MKYLKILLLATLLIFAVVQAGFAMDVVRMFNWYFASTIETEQVILYRLDGTTPIYRLDGTTPIYILREVTP